MNTLQTMACAVAFAMPQLASAQAAPADRTAPGPAAPPPQYESAFSDYKPYRDEPVADWRQVNDTVRQAADKGGDGTNQHGHKTPADGRTLPGAAAPATDAPARKQMDHGMHGGRQ